MARDVAVVDEVFGAGSGGIERRAALRLDLDRCTIADLIRVRVEQEIARDEDAFLRTITGAPPLGPSEAEVRLNPEAGRARQLAAAAPTSARQTTILHARQAEAVRAALDAFAAGRFLLLIDDAQVDDLDAEISINDIREICFVRLLPLQGG